MHERPGFRETLLKDGRTEGPLSHSRSAVLIEKPRESGVGRSKEGKLREEGVLLKRTPRGRRAGLLLVLVAGALESCSARVAAGRLAHPADRC